MGIGDMLFHTFVVYPVVTWLSSPQRPYSYGRRILYSVGFLCLLGIYQLSQSPVAEENYYGVLDVTYLDFQPVLRVDANISTIHASAPPKDDALRKAYKRLLLQYHPDKQPAGASLEHLQASEQRLHQVKDAYEVLIDPHRRAVYNLFGVEAVEILFARGADRGDMAAVPGGKAKGRNNGKGKGKRQVVSQQDFSKFQRGRLLQLCVYYGATAVFAFFTTVGDAGGSIGLQGCYLGLLCMLALELYCCFHCDPVGLRPQRLNLMALSGSGGGAVDGSGGFLWTTGATAAAHWLLQAGPLPLLRPLARVTMHDVTESLRILFPIYMNGFCRCLLVQLAGYHAATDSVTDTQVGVAPELTVRTVPPAGLSDSAGAVPVNSTYAFCALALLNNNVLLETQMRSLCHKYARNNMAKATSTTKALSAAGETTPVTAGGGAAETTQNAPVAAMGGPVRESLHWSLYLVGFFVLRWLFYR